MLGSPVRFDKSARVTSAKNLSLLTCPSVLTHIVKDPRGTSNDREHTDGHQRRGGACWGSRGGDEGVHLS